MKNLDSNLLAIILFVFATAIFSFGYGIAVYKFNIFPYHILNEASKAAQTLLVPNKLPWYYKKADSKSLKPVYIKEKAYKGVNLVTSVSADNELSIRVVNMLGNTLHEWDVDWFSIWPDPVHLPDEDVPKSKPGTDLHGTVLMSNGDLIFNFEHLGLVKMDICGNVLWRLAYRTHHSIHLDDNDSLWVSANKYHYAPVAEFPNHKGPRFIEPVVLEISQDGEVIQEISVLKLLQENSLSGLLYMSTLKNGLTEVTGDTLHLNDVEPFLGHMQEGAFTKGDILISLRNINTILVFNSFNRKIKYINTGYVVRQHDPDFIDGNNISIFDNNNIAPKVQGPQSKIVILNAKKPGINVYFSGDEEHPFFTNIMGKHQWLPNANLLISEATTGRAFEIDSNGEKVWEYFNIVGEDTLGIISEVQRLPQEYSNLFESDRVAKLCKK